MDFANTQKHNNMQHYFFFFKLNKFVIQITILSF